MVLSPSVSASRQERLAGDCQALASDGKFIVGILMGDIHVQHRALVRRKQDGSHTELMLLMEKGFPGEAGIAALEERCLRVRMAELPQLCSLHEGSQPSHPAQHPQH